MLSQGGLIQPIDAVEAVRLHSGVVIQSPCAVVKELIENSLDAQATIVTVRAPLDLSTIKVEDNGTGIAPPYDIVGKAGYTSKTHNNDNPTEANSTGTPVGDMYGYRGYALAAISSQASKVSVATKHPLHPAVNFDITQEDTTTVTPNEGLKCKGTAVLVDSPFSSTPVRERFWRDGSRVKRQWAAIQNVCFGLGLIHPRLKLLVYKERKLLSPDHAKPVIGYEESVKAMLGVKVYSALDKVEVANEDNSIEVTVHLPKVGAAGVPASRASDDRIFCFINKRLVKWRQGVSTLRSAYLLTRPPSSSTREPILLLNLTLPHSRVDVTVCPQKSEVFISQENEIIALLQTALSKQPGLPKDNGWCPRGQNGLAGVKTKENEAVDELLFYTKDAGGMSGVATQVYDYTEDIGSEPEGDTSPTPNPSSQTAQPLHTPKRLTEQRLPSTPPSSSLKRPRDTTPSSSTTIPAKRHRPDSSVQSTLSNFSERKKNCKIQKDSDDSAWVAVNTMSQQLEEKEEEEEEDFFDFEELPLSGVPGGLLEEGVVQSQSQSQSQSPLRSPSKESKESKEAMSTPDVKCSSETMLSHPVVQTSQVSSLPAVRVKVEDVLGGFQAQPGAVSLPSFDLTARLGTLLSSNAIRRNINHKDFVAQRMTIKCTHNVDVDPSWSHLECCNLSISSLLSFEKTVAIAQAARDGRTECFFFSPEALHTAVVLAEGVCTVQLPSTALPCPVPLKDWRGEGGERFDETLFERLKVVCSVSPHLAEGNGFLLGLDEEGELMLTQMHDGGEVSGFSVATVLEVVRLMTSEPQCGDGGGGGGTTHHTLASTRPKITLAHFTAAAEAQAHSLYHTKGARSSHATVLATLRRAVDVHIKALANGMDPLVHLHPLCEVR